MPVFNFQILAHIPFHKIFIVVVVLERRKKRRRKGRGKREGGEKGKEKKKKEELLPKDEGEGKKARADIPHPKS